MHKKFVVSFFFLVIVCVNRIYNTKQAKIKKAFVVMSLLFAGLNGFASDLSEKPSNESKTESSSVKVIVKPVFIQCCSTASMQLPNGNVVSCTACAETCSGPQGSEARAADCLMDFVIQGG